MTMNRCGKIHNVMILENHLGMGGLEKKLYDFVSRIDRGHYRVVACCLKDAGHLRDPFIGLGVPMYERLLKNKYDALGFPRLLSVLDKEKIDLVYTLPHPNSVIFASLARRLGRVKRVVVSIHGTGGPMGGRMVRVSQALFRRGRPVHRRRRGAQTVSDRVGGHPRGQDRRHP